MRRYQALLLSCCLIVLMFSVIVYVCTSFDQTEPAFSKKISCFWSRSSGILELGHGEWGLVQRISFISLDDVMLLSDRCIFFHESSCSEPMLTPRQACAVESAARNNPRMRVFLLYLSAGEMDGESLALKDILESYKNVYIRRIRLSSFVKDTPLKNWYRERLSDFIEDEDWLPSRISDYVRLLILWKYSGISLNLDSVTQSRLDYFSNFIGVTDLESSNVGVLGFERNIDIGRKIGNACMNFVNATQVDYNWNHNLTYIVTKAIHSVCFRDKSLPSNCKGLRVYNPETFYPVPENEWRNYFQENNTEQLLNVIKKANIIHVWNEYSKDEKMLTNSSSPYNLAAKKNCPKIHGHCVTTF